MSSNCKQHFKRVYFVFISVTNIHWLYWTHTTCCSDLVVHFRISFVCILIDSASCAFYAGQNTRNKTSNREKCQHKHYVLIYGLFYTIFNPRNNESSYRLSRWVFFVRWYESLVCASDQNHCTCKYAKPKFKKNQNT